MSLTEVENHSLLTNCEEISKKTLNNLVANAVKNLNIPNYKKCESLAEDTEYKSYSKGDS